MSDKRVAIYIRVSTNEQATEGYSIPEQKTRCIKYCDAMEYTVAKIYIDPGYSGANIDRPALQQLISDINSNLFDVVIVHKLDRLSRSQKDTLYLIEDVFLKKNVSFISMSENFDTESPFGRAMIGILSVFAQLEREQIKERMAMGRIGAAKMGRWRGGSGVPIGYDYTAGDEGVLKVNEYEASQIRELFNLWVGGKSSHEICRILKKKGYTNKYGGWSNPGILPDMITNPIYIGMQRYAGEIFPGLQDAIISKELFKSAAAELKRRRALSTENQKTAWRGKNLLSGLIFCGECGARYFVTNTTRVNKKTGERTTYKYYKCYTRDGNSQMKHGDTCGNKLWRKDYLEDFILSEIRKLAYDIDSLADKKHKTDIRSASSESAVSERLRNIDKQIKLLLDLYQLDKMPLDEVGIRISKLRNERDSLQESTKSAEIDNRHHLAIGEAKKILSSSNKIIETGSEEEKKNLITKLIRKIVIKPNCVEITWSFT